MSRRLERDIKHQSAETQQETQGYIPPVVLRDSRGRVLWKVLGNKPEENEQIGIRNIQGLFLERFPEFETQFAGNHDGTIVEEKREEAKAFILEKIGKAKLFGQALGMSAFRKKIAPYFDGSHLTAIKLSFQPWGIVFEELNDDGQVQWVSENFLRTEYGFGSGTHKRLVRGVPHKRTQGANGNIIQSYDQEVLRQRVEEFFSRPRVNRTTGRLTVNEETWVSLKTIAEETGIDISTLRRKANDAAVHRMDGRGKQNRQTVLYQESELRAAIADFESAVKSDPTTGVYVANGKRYINANMGRNALGLNAYYMHLVEGLPFIYCKDKVRKVVKYFEEDLLLKTLREASQTSGKGKEIISVQEAREELMKLVEVEDE